MSNTPNSGSKKKHASLYERDTVTGKLKLLPLPDELLKSLNSTKFLEKKSSEKKQKRNSILQPLNIAELDWDEKPKKKLKLEVTSASKSLTQPRRGSERLSHNLSVSKSGTQRSACKSLILKKPIRTQDKSNAQQVQSPLVNLEEVEETLINTKSVLNGFQFKNTKLPQKFNFTKNVPLNMPTPSRMSVIDEEQDANDSFKENELICMDLPQKDNMHGDEYRTKEMIDMTDILIREEEIIFAAITKTYQDKIKHLKKYRSYLVSKLSDKENERRVIVTTPTAEKKENLRKTVLTKNFQSDQTPRTRSAMSMFNELRYKNPLLIETPKLRRRSKGQSPGKELSDALMKQCLLLQK